MCTIALCIHTCYSIIPTPSIRRSRQFTANYIEAHLQGRGTLRFDSIFLANINSKIVPSLYYRTELCAEVTGHVDDAEISSVVSQC